MDTNGRLQMVNLTPAGLSYDRMQLMDKSAFLDSVIEVVRCIDGEPGFNVPRGAL